MSTATTPVRVVHPWTADQQARAQRLVWRHTAAGRWLLRGGYVVVGLALLFVVTMVVTNDGPIRLLLIKVLPWVIIGGLWVVLLRGGPRFLMRWSARQSMADPSAPFDDEVSADGFARRHGQTEFRVGWGGLHRVIEGPDFVLFFHTRSCAYYLPTDRMNETDAASLHRLIHEHVEASRITADNGRPVQKPVSA